MRAGLRSHRRLAVLVAAGLAVTAVAAGVVVALFTSMWSARTVRVDGVHRLSAATVLATADVNPRAPLLRLPKGRIARRIEALPDVRSARVSTALPGSVTITVVERTPAAFRQTTPGHWQYIDTTGHYFDTLTARPKHLAELVPAPALADDVATLSALATVAEVIPASLRKKIESISAAAADRIDLILRDKRVVFWGGPQRSADKAGVLVALLRRDGETFDVSNPDLVVAH